MSASKKSLLLFLIASVISAFLQYKSVNAAAYVTSGTLVEYSEIEVFLPSGWAAENVKLAERLGLGYPGRIERYDRKLTRKELAYVSVKLYEVISGETLTLADADRSEIGAQYTDSYKSGRIFDDEVFLAIKHNLMYGTSDNQFSPDGLVTREQTAAVLYRIVERVKDMSGAARADLTAFSDYNQISGYASDCISVMVGLGVLSGVSEDKIAPKNVCSYEEVLAISVRFINALVPEVNINLTPYGGALLDSPNVVNVHTSEIEYQGKKTEIMDAEWLPREGAIGYAVDCVKPGGAVLRSITTNTGITIFESEVYADIGVYSIGLFDGTGIISEEGSSLLNPVLDEYNVFAEYYEYNDYSSILSAAAEDEHLYSGNLASGNTSRNPKNITLKSYSSSSEATADMSIISVNIWKLGRDGLKTPATATLSVHKEVAQDVIEIFDEIFNGPEQFPIYAVAGYSWRGAGSKSSHNNGLAIDINPDHNYFINTSGGILAGKMWDPSQSPYSIKPDGDVVKAFERKGWYWGGIGWSTTGKDYMHFSYTGT